MQTNRISLIFLLNLLLAMLSVQRTIEGLVSLDESFEMDDPVISACLSVRLDSVVQHTHLLKEFSDGCALVLCIIYVASLREGDVVDIHNRFLQLTDMFSNETQLRECLVLMVALSFDEYSSTR